jgi:O-antigen/teichoic acid export membrane protein
MPATRLRFGWDVSNIKLLAAFAVSAFTVTFAAQLIYNTDSIIIGMYISVSAVTGYSLVLKLIQMIRAFLGSGVTALGYYTSAQAALNNEAAITNVWQEGTKWSLALSLPMCIVCMFLAPDLLKAWAGDTFGTAPIALAILSFGQMFEASQIASYQVLVNSGRHRPLAIISGVEAVVNLLLSIVLIKSIGIVGVAVGTLVPSVLRNLIAYPYLMKRSFDIGWNQLLTRCLLPASICSVPTIALVSVYRASGIHSDRVSLSILLCLCGGSAILASYFICIPFERRERFMKLMSTYKREGMRRFAAW